MCACARAAGPARLHNVLRMHQLVHICVLFAPMCIPLLIDAGTSAGVRIMLCGSLMHVIKSIWRFASAYLQHVKSGAHSDHSSPCPYCFYLLLWQHKSVHMVLRLRLSMCRTWDGHAAPCNWVAALTQPGCMPAAILTPKLTQCQPETSL